MVTVECEECGKKFKVKPSRKDTARFCSQECMLKWRSRKFSGKGSPRWKKEGDIKCDYCGKKIHKKVAQIKRDKHHFCSKECADKWKEKNYKEKGIGAHAPTRSGKENPNWKKKIKKKCKYCGGDYFVKPSREKTSNFCSKECYNAWRSENPHSSINNLPDPKKMRGEKHPRWKGGREPYYGPNWCQQKKKVLQRDNHICQRCGKTKEEMDREPDVHHIKLLKEFKDKDGNINFKEANKLSNLITLCRSCHGIIENLPVTIER